jgi:TolB-like protein/tetratricopeptide (TPR) repeat protein
MASIIPGYEYDIFISYRQKDNKYDGWVTEFVTNLRKELEATFKEEISIYFDENPSDGILETHDVDKSLEGKLKCLIFIPIISQTYCDPKSFAWQNEFIAFNRSAGNDSIGDRVRLSNGNVTGRILPVKIHDLDLTDKTLLENELGGIIRSIDFIFKSPGVNRPLKRDDSRSENLNHTYYRDQINKVANAIKEIVSALKYNGQGQKDLIIPKNTSAPAKISRRVKLTGSVILIAMLVISGYFLVPSFAKSSDDDLEKSIAVLPFEVYSQDPRQEYLGYEFADVIITALGQIKDLIVIGKESSFQFKGKNTDLREIGQKLNVSTLLSGSVQVSGNKLRIAVKLINVKDGSNIWTKEFKPQYTMENLFAIHDEITLILVEKFKISAVENPSAITKPPTKSSEAYEMVTMGNYFLRQGPAGGSKALELFQDAIKIDSVYADAYLGLSMGYFFSGQQIKMKEALDKAHILNVNEVQYHKGLIAYYFVYEWNWEEVRKEYEKWLSINSPGHIAYAWYLAACKGKFKEAIDEMEVLLKDDPLYTDGLRNISTLCILNKQYDKAERNLMKIIDTDPNYAAAYERMGYNYYCQGKYEEAIENFKKSYILSGNLSSKLEIVIALAHSGKKDEAKKLFEEFQTENKSLKQKDFVIGTGIGAGYATSMAMVYFSFGEPDEAFIWLNKAYENREGAMIGLKIDPIYDPFRNDPRFIKIYKKMNFPE